MIHVCRSPLTRRKTAPGAAAGTSAPWGDHDPERPGWDCRACHAPWPCVVAQQRLQTAYQSRRRDLGILLATLRDQAVIDLPNAEPPEVGNRFTSWYRRRDPLPAPPQQSTVVRTPAHDAERPMPGTARIRHRPGRMAPVAAPLAALLTETDHSHEDCGQVLGSVINVLAAARAWIAAVGPDHAEQARPRASAPRVVHVVDPRTGRRR